MGFGRRYDYYDGELLMSSNSDHQRLLAQTTLIQKTAPETKERSVMTVRPRLAAELQKLGAKRLAKCYNCGTCTAICPLSKEQQEFPRIVIRHAILGLEDKLLSSPTLWLCYYCGECSDTCPKDADPGSFMMAARRYAIKKYSWGRVASLFYGGGLATAGGLLATTLVAVLGVLLLKGPATLSPVNLQRFFSFQILHDLGLWLGAFVGLSAVANLAIMARSLRVGSRKKTSTRKGIGIWISTLVKSVIKDTLAQISYLKCTNKNRYYAHMALFWGFIGLSLATSTDFLLGLGKIPLYPVPPQRIVGIASGLALTFGAVYYIYKRLSKNEQHAKFSHFSDWMFLLLLLLSGVTGLLLALALYMNSNLAAYGLYSTHLVAVFDLIVLAPFTKFAHAIYRPLALWVNETMSTHTDLGGIGGGR
jgi:heterodisulfide reductase subunit C